MTADGFRAAARDWLARHAGTRWGDGLDGARRFQAALHTAGYAGIAWPVAYGGQGRGADDELAFAADSAGYGLPTEPFTIGLRMVGPTLLAFGTEGQRRRYLPPLLRGEEIWCQLMSEPGAGSDLAALATRAEPDGDGFVVTGQKVWTSRGQWADLGVLLARTDPRAPKHHGITMFVVDMHAPGVTVRPLRDLAGREVFNEVFLDRVRMPAGRIIGERDGGWAVAMAMLTYERQSSAAMLRAPGTTITAAQLAHAATGDRAIALDRVGRVRVHENALASLRAELAAAARAGADLGARGSVAKLAWAALDRLAAETAAEVVGADVIARPAQPGEPDFATAVGVALSTGIAGGTDEIQRNIVGERLLGLPRDGDTATRPAAAQASAGSAELDALRDTVRGFLTRHAAMPQVRAVAAGWHGWDRPLYKRIAGELDLVGLAVPGRFGGSGAGWREVGVVCAELGRALAPVPYLSVTLAAQALVASGDERSAAELLPSIVAGATVAVWVRPPDGAVTACGDRLTGMVPLVADALAADVLLLPASGDDGLGLYTLSARGPGVRRERLEALDPTRRLARLELAGARARRLSCTDADAAGVTAHLDDLAALLLAAEQYGGLTECVRMAVAYAKERTQFGRPIGAFQAVKHRCADLHVAAELAGALCRHAATVADTSPHELPEASGSAKAYLAEVYHRVAAQTVHLHGGLGFTWEHDAHLYHKRALTSAVLHGDATGHRLRVAARLGPTWEAG
jgi:acyl-CoA dehydrogenase